VFSVYKNKATQVVTLACRDCVGVGELWR